MSKSMLVTLPVVMILLDYWPLGRFESKKGSLILWQIREKITFFIFSAFFSILSIYAQPRVHVAGWPFPLKERIINALVSFVIYLEKTFWPHDLAVCYPFFGQAPLWQVSGAVLLILLISVAIILTMKRLPYLFVGWLWYSITLLPVIGIIPVGNNSMADRYIYLPSIGITIMLVWGVPSLIKSEEIRKKILLTIGIAVLAILIVLTWQQCVYWKNSITLYSHSLQVNKDNHIAHNNLGLTLFNEGKTKEAIYHYNKAINRKPNFSHAYYNRGIANFKLGQYQQTIEDCDQAIRLEPNFAKAYNNRGSAYFQLGQYQRSIEDYNKAILLKPDYADAYKNRGFIYLNHDNKNLGCADAQKTCALGNCNFLEEAKKRGYCR
jgi:protein O-mannosyl-transferase